MILSYKSQPTQSIHKARIERHYRGSKASEISRFNMHTREVLRFPSVLVFSAQGVTTKALEKDHKKSEQLVVAMKYVKAYGAKGLTHQTFLKLKHNYHNEGRKLWQVKFKI